jgi:hypothetical protein
MSSENITPSSSAKNNSISLQSNETGVIESVPSVPLRSNGTCDGTTLVKMITRHYNKPEIVSRVAAVITKPDDYNAHQSLKNSLEAHNLGDEITMAYMDEYHEFMYERYRDKKEWYKFNSTKTHCTKKGPDGLTLPAVIFDSGTKRWHVNNLHHREDIGDDGYLLPATESPSGLRQWCKHGKLHRTEKDDMGMTLPAEISSTGTKHWYYENMSHRVELCNDILSKHFGKAMPARIMSNGTEQWFYMGAQFSQETLTMMIKNADIIKKYNIVEEDGVLKITVNGNTIEIRNNN